jgi:hypothetical protein
VTFAAQKRNSGKTRARKGIAPDRERQTGGDKGCKRAIVRMILHLGSRLGHPANRKPL